MAIKTIINNTEKEIEQIKNSDEQDIDYVYSRVGEKEAEGEPTVSIESIGGNLTNYRIYGQTVDGESVGDLVTSGEHAGEYKVPVTVEGKNLLQNTATSQEINGVTFTVNSDGSIVCNGQPLSGNADLVNQNFLLSNGTYILTGCPNGGSERETFKILLYINNAWRTNDKGSGAIFTLTETSTVSVRITIYAGYTCDNLTFYPMIRKAFITDGTYEPYHAPVTTPIYLPEPIRKVGSEAEYIDYGEQKQHRVRKNLLQNTVTSRTISGLTFTVNSDGSVICNGKRENTSTFLTVGSVTTSGEVILNGCPNGGSSKSFSMRAYSATDSNPTVYYDIGNSLRLSNPDTYNIDIRIQAGNICNNLTFYPMIRKAEITDDTYEPYIENTDLDVTLPALSTIKGTNTFLVNTSIQPSNMYIKDNFDYKKVFTATRTIEGELPLNYRSIEDSDSTLSNYRIYGQTVDGESVGDRTGNLFDGQLIDGYYTDNTLSSITGAFGIYQSCKISLPTGTYTIVFTEAVRIVRYIELEGTYLANPADNKDVASYTFTLHDNNTVSLAFRNASNTMWDGTIKIQIVEGSEPLPYEPYGYRVPVTINDVTTNLYLPEQIRKVGDEAEYIDFKEQKQHKVRKNLIDFNWLWDYEQRVPTGIAGNFFHYIELVLNPNTTYNVSSDYPYSFDSNTTAFIVVNSGTEISTNNGGVFGSRSVTTAQDGILKIVRRITGDSAMIPNRSELELEEKYIQVEKGSIATEYESYIENTDLDVTLPALPTIAGTNTLSVGTEVQPSKVYLKGKLKRTIYGWHVNPDISNSSNAVTYLKDAIGMTPASMGSTTFDYGSWENAFFMPKPCMLKSNGKVDYYLDPNDYTKKLNGTASDISNPNYDGNAMMQWPKIWFKYVKGVKEGQGYFYVANYKADGNFHCWCNYDSENNEIDHFYTAIYNGTSFANYSSSKTYVINDFAIYDNKLYKCNTDIATAESFDNTKWDLVSNTAPVINKIRSLSGVRLTNNNGNAQTNTTTEITRATANNTTSAAEWYIETFSDRLLINSLLVLMGKSLNTQAVFGRGLDAGGQSAKEAYVTGTLNDKGLFWGVTENDNSGVKIFGMENFWGCCWHRTAGLITNNHTVKLKLTYGTKDGSTVIGYNQTGNGYIDNGTAPYSSRYVQKMSYNKYGFIPAVVTDGSQSTYYADYHYQNANYTGIIYALFGGNSGSGLGAGAFCLSLNRAPGDAGWSFAASLSCKPLL